MNIGILTSSRADYGIYTSLLRALKNDPVFSIQIIVFGTHLSDKFGYSVQEIERDNFGIVHKIETIADGDRPEEIDESIGKTIINFSKFWKENQFDLVFALGDRFEMFAAVVSGLPFNVRFAHIHGGETTLGAIDNAFRHSISHMSEIHFASAEPYRKRIVELIGTNDNVYNVGALSIDNLNNTILYTVDEFQDIFKVDLRKPSILITLHPETINFKNNAEYADELITALKMISDYQYIITMPNADTTGSLIRNRLNDFISSTKRAYGYENLGTKGYLSAIKHCHMILGNSSSGFIEAGFFPKYVINLGERQKGRIVTPNITNCVFDKNEIIAAVKAFTSSTNYQKVDIYGEGNTGKKIASILKELHV